jgi:hypothetical protein
VFAMIVRQKRKNLKINFTGVVEIDLLFQQITLTKVELFTSKLKMEHRDGAVRFEGCEGWLEANYTLLIATYLGCVCFFVKSKHNLLI